MFEFGVSLIEHIFLNFSQFSLFKFQLGVLTSRFGLILSKIMGKWSLPQILLYVDQVKSIRMDGSHRVRSIAEYLPVYGRMCVGDLLLKIHRSLLFMSLSIILPFCWYLCNPRLDYGS